MHQLRASGRRSGSWLRFCGFSLVVTVAAACSSPTAPTPAVTSRTAGQWSGTTSQGLPIGFSVSADEILTEITIGYRVNGCSGSQTFSNLSVRTAPEVFCMPAPCPANVTSYRAFGYSSRTSISGPGIDINGLFLPGNRAEGQANFRDFPGC